MSLTRIGQWVLFVSVTSFLLSGIPSFAQENSSISGKIVDESTGLPLVGANIYFSNTMLGAATDKEGNYSLKNIPFGRYYLIISYIGYETLGIEVTLRESDNFRLNYRLKQKVQKLDEVLIQGRKPKDWKKHLKTFTEYFIGKSEFAKNCRIVNPEVLGFTFDKKTKIFKAYADDLVIVENKALGYKMYFALKQFEIAGDNFKYYTEPLFEEIRPKNEKQSREWKENREKAYVGSLTHFLASLVKKTTEKEGFKVELLDDLPPDNYSETEIREEDSLFTAVSSGDFQLTFRDIMKVTFLPGLKVEILRFEYPGKYFRTLRGRQKLHKTYPISFVVITEDPVLFDASGYVYDPFRIVVYDTWANYRVAELLPREYKSTKSHKKSN